MDISTITDLKELKAMYYDELARFEVARKNLELLSARIAHLEETPQTVRQTIQSQLTPETPPQAT